MIRGELQQRLLRRCQPKWIQQAFLLHPQIGIHPPIVGQGNGRSKQEHPNLTGEILAPNKEFNYYYRLPPMYQENQSSAKL